MKKYVVLLIAVTISAFSFAQKTELKGAEKALKSNNFASAKTFIKSAEAMKASMDVKNLAKFYYLKGKAYYANGTGSDQDVQIALDNFKSLKETEKKSGKKVYTSQVKEIETNMINSFIEKAQKALAAKNYESSYLNFERVYRLSSTDTAFLYNAAVLATQNKSYDKALSFYNELKSIGYTGVETEYFATNVSTAKKESFPSKLLRDASVRTKTHNNPVDEKSKSKIGEMAKNIAVIYIEKGENEKAIEAIEKAKAEDPENFDLLVAESNVRYKLGHIEKYKELVSHALELQPDNIDLHFNLGVIASEAKEYEEAKKHYENAIKLDPTYVNAQMNMGALILDQEQYIIDEMNKLGSSAADDKRYEELKIERKQLYLDAIPYLETALDLDVTNIAAARTLMNIYSALDDTDNFQKMKAKVEAIENGQ
ncbi:MAG: tetratricopeptide repeat protein [Flavobacteriaceae bacterium]|nr:tetratricopeptide repeat protein [Flavobacteriaceae bacterium]